MLCHSVNLSMLRSRPPRLPRDDAELQNGGAVRDVLGFGVMSAT
jgi:hypothetical protein